MGMGDPMRVDAHRTIALAAWVVVGAIVVRGFDEWQGAQWLDVQRAYADRDPTFEVGLRELSVEPEGRVERCITCHLIEAPGQIAVDAAPIANHSPALLEHHPVEEFGCVVCHDGNPSAVSQEAHAGRWAERPLAMRRYTEANCFRCHDSLPADEAPSWSAGRDVFDAQGCRRCHSTDETPSGVGPSLQNIGERPGALSHPVGPDAAKWLERHQGDANLAYLHQSIVDPDASPAGSDSPMPVFELEPQEIRDLLVYLKSLQSKSAYAERRAEAARPATGATRTAEAGRRLAQQLCASCHGTELQGGIENPNSLRGEFPRLDNFRDKLFLDEDGVALLSSLLTVGDAAAVAQHPEVLALPRGSLLAVRFESTVQVILEGNEVGQEDPNGLAPENMPAWRQRLGDGELESLLLYLLSLEEAEDDEDEED